MQTELFDPPPMGRPAPSWPTIFDFLEVFHNRRRRHFALGMLTPIEFELRNSPEESR